MIGEQGNRNMTGLKDAGEMHYTSQAEPLTTKKMTIFFETGSHYVALTEFKSTCLGTLLAKTRWYLA